MDVIINNVKGEGIALSVRKWKEWNNIKKVRCRKWDDVRIDTREDKKKKELRSQLKTKMKFATVNPTLENMSKVYRIMSKEIYHHSYHKIHTL